jgi:hypothetical protein
MYDYFTDFHGSEKFAIFVKNFHTVWTDIDLFGFNFESLTSADL